MLASDLIDSAVVRLHQGDYQTQHNYATDPLPGLEDYLHQGAEVLHLVNLSGARDQQTRQMPLLTRLLEGVAPALVQVGGSIHSATDVEVLLEADATRVAVSSTAISQPYEVRCWLSVSVTTSWCWHWMCALTATTNGEQR